MALAIMGHRLITLSLWLVFVCVSAAQNPPARTASSTPQSAADLPKLRDLAAAARENNQTPEALRLYQKLVALQPNWAEGWWFLGVLNYDQAKYAPAVAAFQQFVKLEPANGQGWGMLGICESQLQRIQPALKHLEKAFDLKCGGNADLIRVVRFHRAKMLTRVGEFETALGLLTAFAVDHRKSDSVFDAMGMAILRKPQAVESLSAEERLMIREFGQAVFLEGEQRLEEAGQLYEKLETKYRGRPNVAYAYAIDLHLRNQDDQAEKYFKMELERDPDHLAVLLQLANCTLITGALDDGLAYANRAIKLAPNNGIGYYFLGRIHLRRSELPQALAMLKKSAQLEPQAPNIQYSLSQVYAKLNRPQDAAHARAEYERLEMLFKQRRGMIPFEPKESGQAPSDPNKEVKRKSVP